MVATAPQPHELTLPPKLIEEAKRLGVHVEGLSEEEASLAVRKAWQDENREAIQECNAWVEKNGLPLERYRAF
jgi:antitoxin CcdA